MSLFEWTDEYSVRVEELDKQHRKLVEMINDLSDSVRVGENKQIVKPTLDKLLDYTAYHFVAEERLLEQNGYPGLVKHKEDHNALSWRVLDLRSRYEAGEDVDANEVLVFLTGWLKNHILFSDMKYGPFLNSKGVR